MKTILPTLFALILSISIAFAQNKDHHKAAPYQSSENPTKIFKPSNFYVSKPVRDMPLCDDLKTFDGYIVPRDGMLTSNDMSAKRKRKLAQLNAVNKGVQQVDDRLQMTIKPELEPVTRNAIIEFDNAQNSAAPPDPSMAVGPNHIVTMENGTWSVYDKTGVRAAGFPKPLNQPLAGPNHSDNAGDPVVMYDREADRWFISQFQLSGNSALSDDVFLIGISTTPDPTGSYNVYEYELTAGNDYPHYGVWGDSYVTAGNFTGNQKVYTFNRNKMIAGDATAEIAGFSPANLSVGGFAAPIPVHSEAAGAATGDIKIVFYQDDAYSGVSSDHIGLWNIDMDWSSSASITSSTISGKIQIPVSSFDSTISGNFANLAQPGTSQRIDAIVGAVMNMSHWYKFPSHESILLNWVVEIQDGTQKSGIRWVEMRSTNGGSSWSVYQEGTFTDPAAATVAAKESVFMGCMSMDKNGNIGLGYTKTGTTTYPSLYYTGRMNGDPLGQMTVPEVLVEAGTTSVTNNDRYGDYGQGVTDPTDDLTFWVTSEYSGDPGFQRKTRVYSYQLTPPLDNDVAITAIIEPAALETGLTNAEQLQITLTNLGGLSQTGIAYEVKINNVLVASETYVPALAGGASVNINVPTLFDLSAFDTYDICVTTLLPTDANTANDELCKTTLHLNCIPTTTTSCNVDGIKQFVLGSINVDNGGTGCNTDVNAPQGYSNRTSLSTDLDRRTGFNVHTLQAITGYNPERIKVWIDFNENGLFTDAGEEVINELFTSINALNSFSLTVPTGTTLGTKLLRARAFDSDVNSSTTGPCDDVVYGETQDYTVNIVDPTVSCAGSTITWIDSGWVGGVAPSQSDSAIINGTYNTAVNGNIDVCELIVNTGEILTIAANSFLRTQNNITINGDMYVSHQGSVVQVDDNAITVNNGVINVSTETLALKPRDFTASGSPMSSVTREDDLAPLNRVMQHLTANFISYPGVTGFNFLDDNYDNHVQHTGVLNPGEGYFIRPRPINATGNEVYSETYTTGTLNSGDVPFAVGYNGSKANSYNLLANPYASAIDARLFIAENNMVDEVFLWEHTVVGGTGTSFPGANVYNHSMENISMFNLTGPMTAATAVQANNGYLSTSQGFGILATASGTAIFNNAMRITDNNNTLRAVEQDMNRLWVRVSNNTYDHHNTTLIGFVEDATNGLDSGYDSGRLATVVSLYSHLDDGSEQLAIQGRAGFEVEAQVKLGFETIIEEEQEYLISLDQLQGPAIEQQEVYLIDIIENVIVKLNEQDYKFISNAGRQDERFIIQFKPREVLNNLESAIEAISVFPNPANGIININSPKSSIKEVTVTDIQGRIISTIKAYDKNNLVVDVSHLNTAVYFITIKTELGIKVEQMIKK